MSRPKLEVTEVWILEEVLPYEGSEIVNVYFDVEAAKNDPQVPARARWRKREDAGWTTRPTHPQNVMTEFFAITKYPIH